MKHYALLGQGISHSLSPLIQQAFAQQCGVALAYELINLGVEELDQQLAQLRAREYGGCNLTMPHKRAAYAWVDRRTPRAELAGAINTITFSPTGQAIGDNTDGVGLLYALQTLLAWDLTGARILLLGGGGAASGILSALPALVPRQVIVTNRSHAAAAALVARFAPYLSLSAVAWSALQDYEFDLIINATANSCPISVFHSLSLALKSTYCYDTNYHVAVTPFMQWAQQRGALAVANGLGMLVGQAAESFFNWYGIYPDRKVVFDQLNDCRI
jgi:shikimate dehydrogenase